MYIQALAHILQLEDYDRRRFVRYAYTHKSWLRYRPNPADKRPRMTLRLVLTMIGAASLQISLIILVLYGVLNLTTNFHIRIFSTLVLVGASMALTPLLMIISDILLTPLVRYQKNKEISAAQGLIASLKRDGLIIVGITGSFGKTTTKNICESILSQKYKVLSFPGNTNTDIGIAREVRKNYSRLKETEVLILEAGAYKEGEIRRICKLAPPDYSITTSIGENHLDRFGSMESLTRAKFELANSTSKLAVFNQCNQTLHDAVGEYLDHNIVHEEVCADDLFTKRRYLPDFTGQQFEYAGHTVKTSLIAPYLAELLAPVAVLASRMGLSTKQIAEGIGKLQPVKHRLEVIKNEKLDRTIIDDSYNGNYAGFLAGLEVLQSAKGRKVVLTPGIVELDADTATRLHRNLARKYMDTVNLLLLIYTAGSRIIARTLEEHGVNAIRVGDARGVGEDQFAFILFDTTIDAHKDLAKILQNGDTILFQNDITQNYT